MGMTFEVTEPVLFTGNGPLLQLDVPLFSGGPTVESGTYLQPGRYNSSFVRTLEAETPTVTPGQSVSVSTVYSFSYAFARVPVPATAPLMLMGLALVAWNRRRVKR